MEAMQEIYGLRYDFIHRHGLIMKVHRDGGIFAEELSELQLRMLESNTIPRLLPLEVQEIDLQTSFLYHLHAKRMLSQVIKAEGLTRSQCIKLMYTIISAIDQSGNFMLNESQYLLKENFIFIGREITDVYLTYLPFQQLVGEIPLQHQIGTLMKRLVEKVKIDEREQLDKLFIACTEDFKLSNCKQMLLERMGEAKPLKSTENGSISQIRGIAEVDSIPPNFQALPSPLFKIKTEPDSEPEYKNEYFHKEPDDHGDTKNELLRRNKVIVPIALFIALVFIWKSYWDHKQQDALLYISSGFTLLLLAAWFVFNYIGFPKFRIKRILSKKNDPDSEEHAKLMGNWLLQAASNESQHKLPQRNVKIEDYYQNLHQHTTLLSNPSSQSTVFLGGAQAGQTPIKIRTAMIEVNKEGNKRHIPIKGDSFMIGRGESEADYVENEAGISRLHAEIFKAVEGYGVKDLGSKNGTYLNEEQLVPYQSYPIKQGDTIRIIRTEFRLIV